MDEKINQLATICYKLYEHSTQEKSVKCIGINLTSLKTNLFNFNTEIENFKTKRDELRQIRVFKSFWKNLYITGI